MIRIRNILLLLRAHLWPIPLLISLASLGLAYVVLSYGAAIFDALDVERSGLWWLYGGDASTARGLLSSLLSGLMTMTSLVVSVTFVILTVSAQQLGPRLVAIFMGDRQIQAVLGLFIGTILYLLVVLRSIDDALGKGGVPHLAVTVGSLLTVACLFALLFYVHKIARSIVADNVVEVVAADLRHNIAAMLPHRDGGETAERVPPTIDPPPMGEIALGRSGSIQVVDYARLMTIAAKRDLVLRVTVRAGHFVLAEGRHVIVHGPGTLNEPAIAGIREAFVIGLERSPAQDLEFGIRQLVEIGLRALSSGINDPFTAIAVVDHLAVALEDILHRPLQPVVLRDEEGLVRVVADRSSITGLVDAAYDPLRQAASGMPPVLVRMADILGQLAPSLRDEAAVGAVLTQLDKIAQTARQPGLAPADRDSILDRLAHARAAVEEHARLACPQPSGARVRDRADIR
jgi:uncharacterized membrane protein